MRLALLLMECRNMADRQCHEKNYDCMKAIKVVLYSDCNLKTHVSEIEYRVFGFENHLIAPLKCTDTRDMGSTFHVPSLSFANKVLIVLHNKIMSWLINSVSHSFLWSFTICVYCEQEKERGRDAKRKGIYSSSRYFCKIILLYCNRVTELQI